MRSKLTLEVAVLGYFLDENHVGNKYYFNKFYYGEKKERKGIVVI